MRLVFQLVFSVENGFFCDNFQPNMFSHFFVLAK